MTDGARCRSNQRLRKVLHPVIKRMEPGTVFKSQDIAEMDLSSYRDVTPYTIGALLREMDGVQSLHHGVWRRVPA